MSLDYPFYEKLIRLGHPAARWWRIGDILYYPGLLTATGSLSGFAALVPIHFVKWDVDARAWAIRLAVSFSLGLAVFCAGIAAKRHAYTSAARDNIRPD